MKSIKLLIYFLFVITCSYGQHKFGLKLYQNTDFFEITYDQGTGQLEKSDQVNFNRLSLALSIHARNNFTHEIELFIPEIFKPLDRVQFPMNYEFRKGDTFESQISTYSIRYEMNKDLSNNSNRLVFNVGLGLNPYFVNIEDIPYFSDTYYRSDKFYGTTINFTPRVHYKLSDRLILDLNIPLKIYDLRWAEINIENPSVPIRQQTVKDFEGIFFENAYTIRLGLMYAFK